MSLFPEVQKRLAEIRAARLTEQAPLSGFTRFAIGGPAALLFDATEEEALLSGLRVLASTEVPHLVIGGGTNLIVSDCGFNGVILRYSGSKITPRGNELEVTAGVVLQRAVDESLLLGFSGLETMTGIPGFLGGAVYGNAGAYGRSIQEIVTAVRIFDGSETRTLQKHECRFAYRSSIFKERKRWIILSATLEFTDDDPAELLKTAGAIRVIRDAKYPPAMKCAGSIFKNLLVRDLPSEVISEIPADVVREGKVPSAWFLDQVGAKGMTRGDIHVAGYHANLIYNDGAGSARDLVGLIHELKEKVFDRFRFNLEEEVQYIGFNTAAES